MGILKIPRKKISHWIFKIPMLCLSLSSYLKPKTKYVLEQNIKKLMPTTYIYVLKWFKVYKKTRETSEVCKKPVLQNKTGGCLLLLRSPLLPLRFCRIY